MIRVIQSSAIFIGSSVFLIIHSGCSRPLSDSIALSGQETKRALVGYDETSYTYPIRVPGSRQTVKIVTDKPLSYEPDYEDFLVWHATGKVPDGDSTVTGEK